MRWAVGLIWSAVGCGTLPPGPSSSPGVDVDGDAFSVLDGDCDDHDPLTHPRAWDVVGDGTDQDCDGVDGVDADGDGYASRGSGGDDCNDENPTIHPRADEVGWDRVDQDCDLLDRHDFEQVCSGDEHTCAIDTLGRIRCFGARDARVSNAPPLDLGLAPNDGSRWRDLACGRDASCAVTENGALYCWGVENTEMPFLVEAASVMASIDDARRVFMGWTHACVLDDGGSAVCFGTDIHGQVSEMPASVRFVEMALGRHHSCGVHGANRTLTCWGADDVVQTIPDPADRTGWQRLVAGEGFTCGVGAVGSVDCYGLDLTGLPINVAGPWDQLSAKGRYLCGTRGAEPVCMGPTSPFGVVADTPTEVDLRFITVGIDHACGLRSADGELACWGKDNVMQATIPEWPNR